MLRGTRSIELFLSRVSRRGLCVIILTPMAENFAKDKPGVFEYLNSLHPLGHWVSLWILLTEFFTLYPMN